MKSIGIIITALSALFTAMGACIARLHIRRSNCCGAKCVCGDETEAEQP